LAPRSLDEFRPRAPFLSSLVRHHFPTDHDASILDLGCGHGALVFFARQAGYRNVIGIDASPEQVAAAKRLGIEGVSQGDVLETLRSLPDASQDVVVTFDLIEHLTKDELLRLADEVRRTMKDGGRWIIHTANAGSPLFGMVRYGDYTHEQAFTAASINQVLSVSGFRRVHCFEDAPIPHGLKSSVRWVLWKILRSCLRLYVAAEMGTTGDLVFSQCFLAVAFKED
jgi:2-polyprenyl-3-methyl-5-hydroxy-6-metoxy-1,4-benzoquinol methylase